MKYTEHMEIGPRYTIKTLREEMNFVGKLLLKFKFYSINLYILLRYQNMECRYQSFICPFRTRTLNLTIVYKHAGIID